VDHDIYIVGSFDDSRAMATELADLVVAKIKRATASLARREPVPKRENARGCPRFIRRTIESAQLPNNVLRIAQPIESVSTRLEGEPTHPD
jgi:hypothetical protein